MKWQLISGCQPLANLSHFCSTPKADPTSEADDFANEVCKAKGLPVYTNTVSHGVGPLRVTLDLYTSEE